MTSRTKVNMARTALLALQGEGGSPSAVGGARKSHIEAADSAHIYTWLFSEECISYGYHV